MWQTRAISLPDLVLLIFWTWKLDVTMCITYQSFKCYTLMYICTCLFMCICVCVVIYYNICVHILYNICLIHIIGNQCWCNLAHFAVYFCAIASMVHGHQYRIGMALFMAEAQKWSSDVENGIVPGPSLKMFFISFSALHIACTIATQEAVTLLV